MGILTRGGEAMMFGFSMGAVRAVGVAVTPNSHSRTQSGQKHTRNLNALRIEQ